jgi:hypothetical protein
METHTEQDDPLGQAPLLSGLAGRDPFVVPDGFFDRFPNEVRTIILARKHRGSFFRSAWSYRAAIAIPSMALLAAVWWFAQRGPMDQGAHLASISIPSIDDLSAQEEGELLASIPSTQLASFATVGIDLNDDELAAYVEHEGLDLTEYMIEP